MASFILVSLPIKEDKDMKLNLSYHSSTAEPKYQICLQIIFFYLNIHSIGNVVNKPGKWYVCEMGKGYSMWHVYSRNNLAFM